MLLPPKNLLGRIRPLSPSQSIVAFERRALHVEAPGLRLEVGLAVQ